MGIERAHVTSISALATWLNANVPIFGSVAYSDSTFSVYDTDNNLVFRITSGAKLRGYSDSTNYVEKTANSVNFSDTDIISCDNGCIVVSNTEGGSTAIGLLFASTNNGKVACIFNSAAADTSGVKTFLRSGIQHTALGDSTTISTGTTFTKESAQQTIMTTFGTNADITAVSYTPKAFYMPMHSAYDQGVGKFLCGGKVYITNGYWCIDTEQAEEDAT